MYAYSEIKKVTVKESLLHGNGLFSILDISEGQIITKIVGETINADECVKREDEGNVYIFWKDDDTYIDVSGTKELKFLNHSCDYNCEVDEDDSGELVLVATRDIKSGEELTIDYGYDEIYEACSCNECINKLED